MHEKADDRAVLTLENVSKAFKPKKSLFGQAREKVVALNRLSIVLRKAEIFGLVGESGSGKTTAGRLIVGLDQPDEGILSMDGEVIAALKGSALKEYRRRVQMIFQDPYQSLNPQLSIFESVSEPLIIHRIGNRQERLELVLNMLKTVGLSPPEDYIYRFPHQLSGGQRQRVAIARAMVLEPEIVVADEPTSMLDASYSAQIFNILLDVRKRYHVSILFITHSLAAARYLCDRIAVIYRGNLMEQGTAEEVIRRPRHPYTQALIDALPRFGKSEGARLYDTFLSEERPHTDHAGCAFYARCKKADPARCTAENPPLREVAPEHFVACHMAEL